MSSLHESAKPDTLYDIFANGGAMGRLMSTIDWSRTPLGPIENWPQSLRTALSICLASRFPILIWWGQDLVKLYNDAYRVILGTTKHPKAMGQRGKECWPEIWDVIGPMLESVLHEGKSTWSDDQLLLLDRNGYIEECYFTFFYSPIRDETGGVGGVFTAVTETTGHVLSERRLRTLRELAALSTETETIEEACQIAIKTLSRNNADIPFAALYLLSQGGKQATLEGCTGLPLDTLASPSIIDIAPVGEEGAALWPLSQVIETGKAAVIDDIPARFGSLADKLGSTTPQSALVLPIAKSGQEGLYGFLVTGISPRLALNEEYRGFFELVAGQIATNITHIRAYQEERARAEALAELDRVKTTFFSNVSHEFRTPLTPMEVSHMRADIIQRERQQAQSLQKLTQESIQARNEFISMISHDLKNPLGAIKGYAQLLERMFRRLELEPTIAERMASSLTGIDATVQRMTMLVNELLDLAHLQAGRPIQLTHQSADLLAITRQVLAEQQQTARKHRLRIETTLEELRGTFDVTRMGRVIANLISNAIKYSPKESEIIVRVTQEADPDQRDRYAIIAVQDHGMGIPAQDLPYVFEQFRRGENVAGKIPGTGLGLASVRHILARHGGTVSVISEEGVGSTFTVRLPLEGRADPATTPSEHLEPAGEA